MINKKLETPTLFCRFSAPPEITFYIVVFVDHEREMAIPLLQSECSFALLVTVPQ